MEETEIGVYDTVYVVLRSRGLGVRKGVVEEMLDENHVHDYRVRIPRRSDDLSGDRLVEVQADAVKKQKPES